MTNALRSDIITHGRTLGFDVVRITRPQDFSARLKEWLAQGYHGSMDWMARDPDVRGNPLAMWPEVKSVISVGYNYGPDSDPMEKLKDKTRGNISVYAQGDDYHDIIKKKLKAYGNWLARTYGTQLKVFVDTAPVMEKPFAQAAGIGWQGKHTNLVSKDYGSWLFLGTIYLTMEIEPDSPEVDHCGSCRRCLDVCPTQAFPQPYVLDARKCISYLTIEHKDAIPEELRPKLGNRIYGCDDCLSVCPWNKFAQQTQELAFAPRESLRGPELAALALLDDAAFRETFRKSPIKRIGRNRFVRNVLYAIGNSGDATLAPIAGGLVTDPDPVVADAARWALNRLK
ncbi:MAG: tRNA epoxyqueuosine(34) reductase QueG [Proteobacteria bacterium]|nr:tRNA epoxyqueuosine(34) reductase QueG [Pseudomonadota bacterium]